MEGSAPEKSDGIDTLLFCNTPQTKRATDGAPWNPVNKKDGSRRLFKFVKNGRHKATPWFDMVAKPWRIEAVTSRGRCPTSPRFFRKKSSKTFVIYGDVTVLLYSQKVYSISVSLSVSGSVIIGSLSLTSIQSPLSSRFGNAASLSNVFLNFVTYAVSQ